MKNENNIDNKTEANRGTTKSYIIGFLLSLALTLAAYFLVSQHVSSGHTDYSHKFLMGIISILAITQLIVQLIFFLHLDNESKPRWNLVVFSFAAMVVLILVFGSLWIMHNLQYHHDTMTPVQTDEFIYRDEGIKK